MLAAEITRNIINLKNPIAWSVVWVAIWAFVFRETLSSVYTVWINSNTYAHCIFVIPIAIYFAYQRRYEVFALPPKPAFTMIAPMFLLQCLWLLGFAADIELFKHAAVFGMLSTFVILLFGWQIAKVLWFPIIFIVFAIPIGEELVPVFQLITADLTVFFLKLSGVAVFRDGLFISIPAGMFEVAEACSGIRFFVACVVMGAVISYTSYQTIWKRILFFMFSMFLPVIANGLRAYGTILVAHLVDIKYASGADHLIYGWGFFAFVVLLLVAFSRVGSEVVDPSPQKKDLSINPSWYEQRFGPASLIAIALIMSSVIVANSAVKEVAYTTLDRTSQPGSTAYITRNANWVPYFNGPKFEHLGVSDEGVDYYIAGYDSNMPGAELISEQNRLFDIEKWRYNGDQSLSFTPEGTNNAIRATLLEIGASHGGKRLVLFWYKLPNISSSNSLYIKLFQAFNILLQRGAVGAVIALSVPIESDKQSARLKLKTFAEKYMLQLESMVLFD